MRLAVSVAALLLGLACTSDRAEQAAPDESSRMSTAVLPGPENGGEAFEPHLTIDPADPERMTVAAMYGNPMARGGRAVWVWSTADGGTTWTESRMPAPLIGGKPAGWMPDVVAGTTPDGATVLTSMAGAAAPRSDGLGGIVVSRRPRGDSAFAAPVMIMRDRVIGSSHRVISYDRPWMTIDNRASSPYRGNVYVISGVVEFDLPTRSWAETPPDLADIEMLGLDLAVSKDGGRSFGPARRVADSVFGSDMAVSPDGTLEIVYPGSIGSGSAILHRRSGDGAATFTQPVPAIAGGDSATVGGALLAVRPNGTLMACGSVRRAGTGELRCAERRPSGEWSTSGPKVPVPPGADYHFPVLAGADRGWYLLLYLVDSARTEVAVFRTDGESDFAKLATLATTEGLGRERWCFARDCRFQRNNLLMAGDYMGLVAGGGRLAAAYVLPRPGGPLAGAATVFVSVWKES